MPGTMHDLSAYGVTVTGHVGTTINTQEHIGQLKSASQGECYVFAKLRIQELVNRALHLARARSSRSFHEGTETKLVQTAAFINNRVRVGV